MSKNIYARTNCNKQYLGTSERLSMRDLLLSYNIVMIQYHEGLNPRSIKKILRWDLRANSPWYETRKRELKKKRPRVRRKFNNVSFISCSLSLVHWRKLSEVRLEKEFITFLPLSSVNPGPSSSIRELIP